jgi:hypothetical protein
MSTLFLTFLIKPFPDAKQGAKHVFSHTLFQCENIPFKKKRVDLEMMLECHWFLSREEYIKGLWRCQLF